MAIIIDRRYKDTAEKHWGMKHKIIPSFCCENLQAPVSAHPDMTITPIGDVFVCCPESYEYYRSFLGEKAIKGKLPLSSHYPHDIAYNVLIYKNIALSKSEYTDPVVKEELTKRNIRLINVNQGYAKCSSCVTESGIITADETIYRTLLSHNINALKITPGHIELAGYDYGFIGGASGIIDGVLTFFGDVSCHPDYLKIKEFCTFNYISDFPLTDIGTIFCI